MEWMFEREEISRESYEAFFDIEPKKKKVRVRLEEFSRQFESFFKWSASPRKRTSAYAQRIERYFRKHPGATLKEARGH